MTDDSISGYAAGLLTGQRGDVGPAPRRPTPIPTGEFAKFAQWLFEQFGVSFVLVEVNRAENYAYVRIHNRPAKIQADLTCEEMAESLGFTEELKTELDEKRARELALRPLTTSELRDTIAKLSAENAELRAELSKPNTAKDDPVDDEEKSVAKGKKPSTK